MWQALALTLWSGLAVGFSTTGSVARSSTQPPVELAKPAPARQAVQFTWSVRGIVTDIGKDVLIVTVDDPRPQAPPGAKVEHKPFKRFLTGGFVVDGKRTGELDSDSYRLDQLKKGDQVIVGFYHRDGVEMATDILIRRRPGGIIPVQPGSTPPYVPGTWHVQMQAEQDWEEKGIPIPPALGYRSRLDLNPPFVIQRGPIPLELGAPPPAADPAPIPPAKD